MIIGAVITDDEWIHIEPYVDQWCSRFGNPMEDEFLFYDPDPRLLTILGLYDIEFWPVMLN